MPRQTVNINQPNVEQIELTFKEVNLWINDKNAGWDVEDKIEMALDEAQADIENGSNDIQYVVIKITR
jgi:hypothetical protein